MPKATSGNASSNGPHQPTRILIGHWRQSSEPDPNQHAVYGILSRDDKLRFKLVPETRDGRSIQGNYPPPRETWLIHEDIVFESYIDHLNRLGMKEYCRARGEQVSSGEDFSSQQSAANILKAVEIAENISAAASKERPRNLRWEREKCADRRRAARKEGWAVARAAKGRDSADDSVLAGDCTGGEEPSSSTPVTTTTTTTTTTTSTDRPRAELKRKRKRHSEQRKTVYNRHPEAHISEKAVEAAAAAAAAAAVTAEAAAVTTQATTPGTSNSGRDERRASTSSSATGSSMDDAKSKIYNGITYQRNTTGPFPGKLMAKGKIVSIDGDEYVEYRVLAKV